MLMIGDKIRLVKPIGVLKNIGEEFEVTATNDDIIDFKLSFIGMGSMSMAEYEKHFRKVRVWTDWILVNANTWNEYSYKTDNEKYVRLKKDGREAKASCHPTDEFDLNVGIEICFDRLNLWDIKDPGTWKPITWACTCPECGANHYTRDPSKAIHIYCICGYNFPIE